MKTAWFAKAEPWLHCHVIKKRFPTLNMAMKPRVEELATTVLGKP
jgi:hypothetical protein